MEITDIEKNIITIIEKLIGERIQLKMEKNNVSSSYDLSIGIHKRFNMFSSTLINRAVLFLIPINQTHLENILEQVLLVKQKSNAEPILVFSKLHHSTQRQLISAHIPFLTLDSQAYLPFIFLHIQPTKMETPIMKFTAATQALYIYLMYEKTGKSIDATIIADELLLSLMTVYRSLQQLLSLDLLTKDKTKKQNNLYRLEDIKEYIIIAKEYVVNPIHRIIYFDSPLPLDILSEKELVLLSGEPALSVYSMLSNNKMTKQYAIENRTFNKLLKELYLDNETALKEYIQNHATYNQNELLRSTTLELWKYNPCLLANKAESNGIVDPFSLYLSLHDTEDERIAHALDELLHEFIIK